METVIQPGRLAGTVEIPASKSHTLRALIIAALADGESRILAPLDSGDTQAGARACRLLGAEITQARDQWIVEGTGGRLNHPDRKIDVGNSGTTLYLMTAVAALTDNWIFFTGDEQIQRRSARLLLDALSDLGAEYHAADEGCAPYAVRGPLTGGRTEIACPTSQYLSALLLTAPLAQGHTEIFVNQLNEKPYVRMTLDWLRRQGIQIHREDLYHFHIDGGQAYTPFTARIPGDFSSAAFFLTAAAVTGSALTLNNLSMEDPQGDKNAVPLFEQMGCSVQYAENSLTITGPANPLQPQRIDLNAMPDALPALAAAACFADGTTEIVNVAQARLKETDRIAVMTEELRKMGADITEREDGLLIRGRPSRPGAPALRGAPVNSRGDHRVAMALAAAALGAQGPTAVTGAEAAAITYPGFFQQLQALQTR